MHIPGYGQMVMDIISQQPTQHCMNIVVTIMYINRVYLNEGSIIH